MTYEELLVEADNNKLITKEKNLISSNGRISNNRIAIRKDIPTVQKGCVLAEELGHFYTTTGNIVQIRNEMDLKQERRARIWAYQKLISLNNLINCFEAKCMNIHECAEYLNVTEEFLNDAIKYYKEKYGLYTVVDNYAIYFEPRLIIAKMA